MSKPGKWYLAKEGDWFSIRRMVISQSGSRKQERYSRKHFSHITSEKELRDFVIRLNGKDPQIERIRQKIRFTHAFIDQKMMDKYHDFLLTQIPNEKDANTLFGYLKRYALNFFIGRMNLINPLHWHQNQHIWGKYLLNRDNNLDDKLRVIPKGEILSSKVIKYTINELNRFSGFLHLQKPDIPQLTFMPVSKAALKEHKATREIRGLKKQPQYIDPVHWKLLMPHLMKADWGKPIILAFCYGLRRNEAMGLETSDIKKGCLKLSKQLDKVSDGTIQSYKPLKGRTIRRIPHWFMSPARAYSMVKKMNEGHIYHPDTIGTKFTRLCNKLSLPDYKLHDLRRTFITNAIKKGIAPEDLRQAVGHTNSDTTYRYYVMDARDLDEEDFTPEVG